MIPKVLIVDDELYILESVSYVVKNAGFTPITAEDGETALLLAFSERPRLIILDVMLPHMTGLQVCQQLRRNPDTRNIPVIMLSARGQETDEIQGMKSGADEYMTKPFSPRRLKQRIEELVRNQEPTDG
jgi:two-component system phosphate regulon response regulator PhoB